MIITDVQIRKIVAEGKLKAYATVTFDDCFVLHNVKLIEGEKGIFGFKISRYYEYCENGLCKCY